MRALPLRRLGRAWLSGAVLKRELERPDDLTVLIGVRDRADYRIENSLKSIGAQKQLPGTVHTLIVDYGSSPANAAATEEACRRYGAEYMRIQGASCWSRARCLNIGIRRVSTKFLMTCDADIVLSPTYLSDAIGALRRTPLALVCSQMLDLPEGSAETLRRAADSGEALDVHTYRPWCSPRFSWPLHPSIAITYTAFLQSIRGYDEYYELWGCEDVDLVRRLECLGIRPRKLDADSFYLHQWHPRFEGIPGGEHASQITFNRAHLESHYSIVRNDRSWGLP
jgi:GT2 family glycosyltransferase